MEDSEVRRWIEMVKENPKLWRDGLKALATTHPDSEIRFACQHIVDECNKILEEENSET